MGADVSFVLQDANLFSFDKRFDAAICMWTTIEEEPMQYKKVIRNVFRALKTPGIFVIDNRSWERLPKNMEEVINSSTKLENGKIFNVRLYDRYPKIFG